MIVRTITVTNVYIQIPEDLTTASFSQEMMDPVNYTQMETLALQSKGSVPSRNNTMWEGYFFHISTTKTMISNNSLCPLTPLPSYLFPIRMVLIQSYLLFNLTYFLFVCASFKLYQLNSKLWLNTWGTDYEKGYIFFLDAIRLCTE